MERVGLDIISPHSTKKNSTHSRSLSTKREIWRQKLLLVHIRPGDAQGLSLLFRYVKKRNILKKIYEGSRIEGVHSITDTDRSCSREGATSESCGIKSNWQALGMPIVDYIFWRGRDVLAFCMGLSKSSGCVAEECKGELFYLDPDLRWFCAVGEWLESGRVENEHL